MSDDRVRRIEALFAEALQLDPDGRDALLAHEEVDVRDEVRSLLAAAARSDAYFDGLARDIGVPRLPDEDSPSLTGTRVGAYRLGSLIGRGGMGSVYLAQRADSQFEQRVAVKLLTLGLLGPAAHQRFLVERQILARLAHPGIARLLDGGVTDGGTPYFAMDYVDGLPIDTYCNEHDLGVAARLELFGRVCDAVQYAHANLVVHRDLKPANILVSESGDPKLLDFGIAKLQDPDEDGAASTLTRWAGSALTPAYASPEQIRNGPISTASDVYSLGVLLYELLAGNPPYELRGRTQAEIETLVCEEIPPPPSAKAPARWRRKLRGDLDTVVLQALQKDPERRYGSVAELANDLRRHLTGRPVRARPDTLGYRASRFIARNKIGVAAGVAFLALIVGTAVLAVLFAVSSAEQTKRVQHERDRAEQVSQFLVELLEQASPNRTLGDAVTVRQVLDEATDRLRDEMQTQPETRANLMAVIGRVYLSLGVYDSAEEMMSAALETRRELHGESHADVAESLRDLGRLNLLQEEHAEAEALLRKSLAISRGLEDVDPLEHAVGLDLLAETLAARGATAEAEPLYWQALAIRLARLGNEHETVANSLNNLGQFLTGTGDYETAEVLLEDALAIDRKLLGDGHPQLAYELNNLAYLYSQKLGDFAAAAQYLREGLQIFTKTLGPEHPNVAVVKGNLAAMLVEAGDWAGAEVLHRERLELSRKIHGDEHSKVATSMAAYASAVARLGRREEGASLHRSALAMRRKLFGDDHILVADSREGLGVVLYLQGKLDAAEKLIRQAHDRRIAVWGEGHLTVTDSLEFLALVAAARGRPGEAESMLRRALQRRRQQYGDGVDHPAVATDLTRLAKVQHQLGNYAEAEKTFRRALQMHRAVRASAHPLTAVCMVGLGELLADAGRPDEAKQMISQGLAIYEQRLPASHPDIAEAKRALAALD